MRRFITRSLVLAAATGSVLGVNVAAAHACDVKTSRGGCEILITSSHNATEVTGGTTTTRPVIIGPPPAPVPGGGHG